MTTKREKRCYHDIILALLREADSGKVKTRLMYAARLSFTQLEGYLKQLTEKGLITESLGIWTTTPKGRCLVERIGLVQEIIGEWGV